MDMTGLLTRLSAIGGALLSLAGCDDGSIITRVDQTSAWDSSVFATMASGGLPTEIHGVPFSDVTADQVAAALRPPADQPQNIRFRAIAPGVWDHGTSLRLVLVFNGSDHPDADRDCKRREEAPTVQPEAGFSVTATFCSGDQWMATGHLDARKAKQMAEVARLMQNLFSNILREEPDR